jgi:hypothetical protein
MLVRYYLHLDLQVIWFYRKSVVRRLAYHNTSLVWENTMHANNVRDQVGQSGDVLLLLTFTLLRIAKG